MILSGTPSRLTCSSAGYVEGSSTDNLCPTSQDLHTRCPRIGGQRLGIEQIEQLVADYESGIDTTELMVTYQLSKSSVLKLLASRGVAMRHQSMTDEQISSAVALYEEGRSLIAIVKELTIPRETIRRALIDAGVTLRKRGRPAAC